MDVSEHNMLINRFAQSACCLVSQQATCVRAAMILWVLVFKSVIDCLICFDEQQGHGEV